MNPVFGSNGSPEQTDARRRLALAISAKGVPTDPKASFNVMAEKVGLIQQETYELQGDKIYEQQMFGAETISPEPYKQNGPLWNLYKVMTDLLSDARFIGYGGILLAEYYKGYDTIELMNAGAGGAYFTCDGDFYTVDKAGANAHVWHDGDNGMANRWVAYLFAAPDSNYTIPSTELCPRSIHVGRKVGTIFCSFDGRISEIVVTDGNTLYGTNFTGTNPWGRSVVLSNTKNIVGGYVLKNNPAAVFLKHDVEQVSSSCLLNGTNSSLSSVVLPKLTSASFGGTTALIYGDNVAYVELDSLQEINCRLINCKLLKRLVIHCGNVSLSSAIFEYQGLVVASMADGCDIVFDGLEHFNSNYTLCNMVDRRNKSRVYLPKIKSCNKYFFGIGDLGDGDGNVQYLHIGCCGSKTDSILFPTERRFANNLDCHDVEIGDKEYIDKGLTPRWLPCQNISLTAFQELTEENILNHILKRLKADEVGCGSGVTIALGAKNLARLQSEESLAVLESLTNIYGYTFA